MTRAVFDVSTTWRAVCWYVVATLILTWPLTTHLRSDFPGDLGDPLFVSWALARAADHWLALLSGDLGAVRRFWEAGIFHPEPLATAFSEHFIAHALQILPVWVLTRDIILCYNLLFLVSYIVGGTGMYLFARELTGSPRAAFIAGLLFVFTPYRAVTVSHLQVLSSQWMPLALYGLRRYFASGSRRALAGGAAAVLLQNLSSGYYLIYFAPFVALYALVEMWARHLLRQWRVWRDLVVAGGATLALTLPFAIPYVMLQRHFNYRRPLAEIEAYSADLLSWITAAEWMNVWGWLQTWPRNEGVLFPGLVVVVFAIIGAIAGRRAWPQDDRTVRLVSSFALVAALLAVWMAMGTSPQAAGRPLPIPAIYKLFYDYVPGFDVSRVPSRFTTIVVLFLATASAYGLAWLDRTGRRTLLALVCVAALLDGAALPLRRNQVFSTSGDVRYPDARVYAEENAPPVYRFLKTLPADAIVAHLPFGYPEYELRYLFYSSAEGYHRMANGYSGAFPGSYMARAYLMQRTATMPGPAIESLRLAGVTHVVVHLDFWTDDTGMRTLMALEGAGLSTIVRIGSSVVLQMPGRHP
jgi:hypothetical protein